MDVKQELDTTLPIWRCADFSQWSFEVLQQENPIGPKSIFLIDRKTKINDFETADRAAVT